MVTMQLEHNLAKVCTLCIQTTAQRRNTEAQAQREHGLIESLLRKDFPHSIGRRGHGFDAGRDSVAELQFLEKLINDN